MSQFDSVSAALDLLVDGPWWTLLLIKLTLLLLVAWATHFLLVRSNPRWRVVLWRWVTVGLIAVTSLSLLPWIMLPVSVGQIATTTGPIALSSATSTAVPTAAELNANSELFSAVPFSGDEAAGVFEFSVSGLPKQSTVLTNPIANSSLGVDSTSSFSWTTIKWAVAAIWLIGVAVLFIRMIIGRRKLSGWIEGSGDPPDWLTGEVDRLSAAMGIPGCLLRTVEIDGSPLLCHSKTRAVLLLPKAILDSSDRHELRAILTHELSHLRSNDLRWNRIIRVTAMFSWPHPLVWRLAAAHTTACEYSADADSARWLGDTELYRRTLAKVAISASRRQVPGLAMARVADVRRRLELVARTVLSLPLSRRQIMAFGCATMLVTFGIGTLKFVNAQQATLSESGSADTTTVSKDASESAATETQTAKSLTIRLTDLDGKPIHNGTVIAKSASSPDKQLDLDPVALGNGAVRLDLPDQPGYLLVETKAPGRVPMKAVWQIDEWDELPPEFTIPMQKGTTISGRVSDELGQPIADAEVQILAITSELRSARLRTNVYRYPVKTNKQGRWVCDVAPAQLNNVWLRFLHPDYISDDTFGQTANNISVDQLRAGSLVSVLKKGTKVQGKVVDADGQPITGAIVYQGKDRFGSSYPDKKTDAKGQFEFPNSRFGEMVLTVVAKGYAPELKNVQVAKTMESVEIILQPGKRLQVRTVDENGQPLGNVMIVPDTWREIRSLADAEIPRESDQNGVYVWNDAPADVVKFDILARGYMDRRQEELTARDDEYLIKMIKPLRVHGNVTDAATGKPIPQFKVVRGIKWEQRDDVTWELQDAVQSKNGEYEIATTYPRPGHVFRFEAVGYKSVVSPTFQSDQGSVLHNVSMEPTVALTGEVQLKSGRPVVGAHVIINTAGHHVAITNGRFSDARRAVFAMTDDAGKFELPTPAEPFRLIVLHDEGMVEFEGDQLGDNQKLVLKPWASVRGVIKMGDQPAKQTRVHLSHLNEIPYQQPKFYFDGQAVTDDQGRYELPRVPPDRKFQIARVIEGRQPGYQAYTHSMRFETRPGSEHELNVGGTGRPVVGHVTVPENLVDFRIGNSQLTAQLPEPPMPDEIANGSVQERQQWFEQWSKTQAGIAYTAKISQNLAAVIQADGTFRVEDVPAGKYQLNVFAYANQATPDYDMGEQIGLASLEFDVPEMSGGRSDEPLDIGSVEVKPRVFLRVGDTVPALNIKSLDGKPLALTDFQDKYVLLDFWATWCGPCLAEMPYLKKAYQRFVEDENLVILSVSLDTKSSDAVKYVQDNALPWPQGHVGPDDQQEIMGDFGLQSIPASFLLDRSGKIIAKNLRGEDLADQLLKLIKE